MKTLIISTFPLETQFIKNALAELQVFTTEKYTWYKGKFYTKELFLAEADSETDINGLIERLREETELRQIINIGLGIPLSNQLRTGDLLIMDTPLGSCEKMMDIFLNQEFVDSDVPLRIFAGKVYSEYSQDNNENLLACLDVKDRPIIDALKRRDLPILLVRVIVPEADENSLEMEVRLDVAQKLLLLLKKSVEYTS